MNPQFLLDVAKQHMRHCGAEPTTAAAPPSAHLVEGTKMLSFLVEQVPGMQEAQLLLARSQYLQRDFSNATRTLNTVSVAHVPGHLRRWQACHAAYRTVCVCVCARVFSAFAWTALAAKCTCSSRKSRCTRTTSGGPTSRCSVR